MTIVVENQSGARINFRWDCAKKTKLLIRFVKTYESSVQLEQGASAEIEIIANSAVLVAIVPEKEPLS